MWAALQSRGFSFLNIAGRGVGTVNEPEFSDLTVVDFSDLLLKNPILTNILGKCRISIYQFRQMQKIIKKEGKI